MKLKLRYFNKKNMGEIDFVVQQEKNAVLIEIKSGNEFDKRKVLDNVLSKAERKIDRGIVFF